MIRTTILITFRRKKTSSGDFDYHLFDCSVSVLLPFSDHLNVSYSYFFI
jgi:hypothetical protein